MFMHLYLILFLILVSFFPCMAIDNAIVTKLKLRQPNWHLEKVAHFPDGTLKKGIYYAPCDGKETAVKEVLYNNVNELIKETDLISKEDKILYHGPSVSYGSKGNIETILFYHFGTLHGSAKEFHLSGTLKQLSTYENGLKTGPFSVYYEDGKVMKSGSYLHGHINGEFLTYHPNGLRESESTYKKGFLDGVVTKWYENGNIKSKEYYLAGLLNGKATIPAFSSYYEDNAIKEIQHFIYGIACGSHTMYHTNGKESYKVNYKQGKKVGTERYYAKTSSLIGEGEYANGVPIHTHYKKNEDEQIIYLAHYDRFGSLQKPILEFFDSGQKKREYSKDSKGLQGPFLEWNEEKILIGNNRYKDDHLDGLQEEFFNSGKRKLKCFYVNQKKEGRFEEWYENGQKALDVTYKNGIKTGIITSFYPNGNKKSEIYLNDHGKKHGAERHFEENGQLLFQAYFENGFKSGLLQEWYKSGNVKRLAHYTRGVKNGKEELFYDNKNDALKCHYTNDFLDGSYLSYFENGKVFEKKQFVLGKPVGKHLEYHLTELDEEICLAKEMHYKEGQLDGLQQLFYKNRNPEAILNYKLSVLHGEKKLFDLDGKILEEAYYEDGNLNGRYFIAKENGKEIVYHYKNNLLDGLTEIYYPPHPLFGKVKAFHANYEKGVIQGEVCEYNEAGTKLVSTYYKDGLKHGPATFYGHDGKVKAIAEFKNDNQNGWTFEYFPNGQIKREVFFVDDEKEGPEKSYFKNGLVASLKSFKNGLLVGCWQEWNKVGTLIFNAEYFEGKPNGYLTKYNSEGNPYLLHRYEDGKLVEKLEL